MSCKWTDCVERTYSCELNEVITQIKSGKLKCCPIIKTKSDETRRVIMNPKIKKRIPLSKVKQSATTTEIPHMDPAFYKTDIALDSLTTKKSIDSENIQLSALNFEQPLQSLKEDVDESVSSQGDKVSREDDEQSQDDTTDSNGNFRHTEEVSSTKFNVQDRLIAENTNVETPLFQVKQHMDNSISDDNCLHVLFDRDGDMTFGGCKG